MPSIVYHSYLTKFFPLFSVYTFFIQVLRKIHIHMCNVLAHLAIFSHFTEHHHQKIKSIYEKQCRRKNDDKKKPIKRKNFADKKLNLFKNYQRRRANKMFQWRILKAPIKIPKLANLETSRENSIDCGILFYAFDVFCAFLKRLRENAFFWHINGIVVLEQKLHLI